MVLHIQKKPRRTRRDSRRDHYGNCNYKHRFTDGATSQGNMSPSLHKCWCLSEPWNPENVKRKRNHTLQCGCFEHRTLIPNHALINQLSVYGAVSNWCEEFGPWPNERVRSKRKKPVNREILKRVKSHEVNSLVCAPRTEPECLQNFESRSKTSQLTKACELASFWHRAEAGMSFQTIPNVDDGFGDFTQCAENTHFFGQTQDPERMQQNYELFLQREHAMLKAASKKSCSSEHATSEHLENSSGSTPFIRLFRRLPYPLKVLKRQ